MTPAQQASFEYAAQRLGRMITSKLPQVTTTSSLRCESVPDEVLPATLNDMYIYVKITPIDGVSGVLGQAGPCIMDRNGFPRVGYVEFDSADVAKMIADQTFDAVCVHEISHIIGFGTLWDDKRLVGGTTADPRYVGRFGAAALSTIQAAQLGTPPVQDTGGTGTARSHWRDKTFGNEMMTAYLDTPYQPVSALTVESFRDLGYTVDSSVADTYNTSSKGFDSNVPLGGETPVVPKWFDFDSSSFWNSTTIWIFSCLGAALVVIILSCVYSRLKRRNNGKTISRPSAMASNNRSNFSSGQPQQGIPTAFAVPAEQNTYVPTATPVPRSAYGPSARTNYYTVPVGTPATSDPNVNLFLEITKCNNPVVAANYLREADNNVSLAIDRYLENQNRQMASV